MKTNLTAVRKFFFSLFFTFLCPNYYLLKHFFIYFSIKTVTQIGRNYWIKNISQNKCSRLTDHVTLSSKSFYCFSSLPLRPLGNLTNDVGKSGSLSWRVPAYLSCLLCEWWLWAWVNPGSSWDSKQTSTVPLTD